MSTERQRAANQANAAKSTGPRSPEGKAASSQNARKHGLRAKHVTFETFEEQSDYLDRVAELMAAAPPDPMLAEVVHRIAHSEVILHRIERQLAASWTEMNNQTIDNTWGKKEPFPEDPDLIEEIGTSILGKTALGDAAGSNTIGKITRYYGEFERIWTKAVKQYNQIRKEPKPTPKLAVVHEMPAPPTADTRREPGAPAPEAQAPPDVPSPSPAGTVEQSASADGQPQPHANSTQTNPIPAHVTSPDKPSNTPSDTSSGTPSDTPSSPQRQRRGFDTNQEPRQ